MGIYKSNCMRSLNDSCMKRRCLQRAFTNLLNKTWLHFVHKIAVPIYQCSWCMRPGIGQIASCTVGDFALTSSHRSMFFREVWFVDCYNVAYIPCGPGGPCRPGSPLSPRLPGTPSLPSLPGTPSRPSLPRGPWTVCILGMLIELSLVVLSCVDCILLFSLTRVAAGWREGMQSSRSDQP